MKLETLFELHELMQEDGAVGKSTRFAVNAGIAAAVAGSIFVLDRLFKNSIEAQPDEAFPHDCKAAEQIGLKPGLIRFEKHHNPGFAFGRLKEQPLLVRMLPAAVASAAAAMLLTLCEKKGKEPERLALSLIVGGGISNLYDRLRMGYVVDFLNIRVGQLKKVVLNLGDVAIALGSLLLVLCGLFRKDN